MKKMPYSEANRTKARAEPSEHPGCYNIPSITSGGTEINAREEMEESKLLSEVCLCAIHGLTPLISPYASLERRLASEEDRPRPCVVTVADGYFVSRNSHRV